MPSRCSVPQCKSDKGGHRFPRDESRSKQWLTAIRRENFVPTKESVVCKKHFTPEDYTLPKDSLYSNPRLRLRKEAIPSVFCWNKKSIRRQKKNEDEKEMYRRRENEDLVKGEIEYIEVEIESFSKDIGVQVDVRDPCCKTVLNCIHQPPP